MIKKKKKISKNPNLIKSNTKKIVITITVKNFYVFRIFKFYYNYNIRVRF